jgi:hypothetical protein
VTLAKAVEAGAEALVSQPEHAAATTTRTNLAQGVAALGVILFIVLMVLMGHRGRGNLQMGLLVGGHRGCARGKRMEIHSSVGG